MRRSFVSSVAPTLLATLLSAPAVADFLRFDAVHTVADSGGTTYHAIEVYAVFSSASDRILNCFEVSLDLVGAGTESFYNASSMPAFPETGQPMQVIPDPAAYAYDSFVTIGSGQGDLTNGTLLDPEFNDVDFVTLGVIDGGGWYNVPPSNGHGDAGGDFKVLLGRFSITNANHLAGARIQWTATIGYTPGGITTLFGTESKTFYFQPKAVPADAAPEDVDGDAKGDLIWHNPLTGGLSLWRLDGLTWLGGGPLVSGTPAGWTPQGAGDLDGDGDPDLVFRDPANVFQAVFIENSQVASIEQISNPVPAPWVTIALADINADGRADVVLHNPSTTEVRAWLMDAQYRWTTGTIAYAAGLTFVAAADLDGDDKTDLLWRLPSGVIVGWLVDGLGISFNSSIIGAGAVSSTWSVVATGDLDADGDEDLVWRDALNGTVSGWLMNGLTRTAGAPIVQNIPAAWQPISMEDLDGDGDDDLVWRDSSNSKVNGWIMQGLVRQSGGFIKNAAPGWTNLIR